MVICASGNDPVTMLGNTGTERFCVEHNLSLIFAELRLERFMKTNCLGSDHVHERAALHAGENSCIDLLRELLFANHNAATRPAQTLVRRAGDKLRMRDGARMLTSCHEACDMRHVDEQKRADRIRDLAQPREIDDAPLTSGTCCEHDWPVPFRF